MQFKTLTLLVLTALLSSGCKKGNNGHQAGNQPDPKYTNCMMADGKSRGCVKASSNNKKDDSAYINHGHNNQPQPQPINPTPEPQPITPNPQPITPEPQPITPNPQPITPAPQPVQPNAQTPVISEQNALRSSDQLYSGSLKTDKAAYKPNETVRFTLDNLPSSEMYVRYSQAGKPIGVARINNKEWTWQPPSTNDLGYIAEVFSADGKGRENTYATIAIDVSSDWIKFPRYGFLTQFGNLSDDAINQTLDSLARYHINGIQFYDWQYAQHKPYPNAGTWKDILGRTTSRDTLLKYINGLHSRNMKAMFYNLGFGALDGASTDGVSEEWYVFKDTEHKEKDKHDLDNTYFRSDIYLLNPANTDWQRYLVRQNENVYDALPFDGFHIDQLGGRGRVYDYKGNFVDFLDTYAPLVRAMKTARPDKRLVMNAVGQYGQSQIASTTDTDFLYTEVWDEHQTFADIVRIIQENDKYGQNQKRTMLAAYMDYNKAKSVDTTAKNADGTPKVEYVNYPGVLLADAVIFAHGGAHLELGEHYLTNEYFPLDNLKLGEDLKQSLINYYDFMVGYENLLRGEGEMVQRSITADADSGVSLAPFPAALGQVATTVKQMNGKDVVHLINFVNANSMGWQDTNGTQRPARELKEIKITIAAKGTAQNVWFASPDWQGGAARKLKFTQTGKGIEVTVPALRYWDMLVVEY